MSVFWFVKRIVTLKQIYPIKSFLLPSETLTVYEVASLVIDKDSYFFSADLSEASSHTLTYYKKGRLFSTEKYSRATISVRVFSADDYHPSGYFPRTGTMGW